MSAADYRGQTYAAIANGLEAWSPVSSVIRTRVRFDDENLELPVATDLGDSDFPRWLLWPANFTDSMFRTTPAFGDNAPGYDPTQHGWLEQFTDNYMLTVVHASRNVVAIHQLEEDIATALRNLGPTLGLSFIQFVGKVTGRRVYGVTPQTGSAERFETTITIPVQMQFQGNQLFV